MISGIINLKKEAGMTSHDAVFKLRRILKEKKIGHGGTLDPDVSGVLPIAVGKATRLIEYMQETNKVYQGQVTLGFSTNTEDASGEILERTDLPSSLTEEAVDRVMASFMGQIKQVPPLFSAVKVKGRKLYDYARSGEQVERPERQVTIYEFIRTSPLVFEEGLAHFSFRVTCSKGAYIRTLAVDLGVKLGIASHLSALERTASSGLVIEDGLTLAQLEERVSKGDFSFLLPMEKAVQHLNRVTVSEADRQALVYGQFLKLEAQEGQLAAFYDDKLVAILEKRSDGFYKPKKVFI